MKTSKSVVMKHKKVSKTSRRAKPESISIHLKRPIVKSQAHVTPSDNNNIKLLARQLKQRLSAAAATVTNSMANNNNLPEPDIDVVVEPTLSNSDWPTKTPALRNLKLLKQYLLFVSQEDHTTVQLNSKDHSIQFNFSGDTKYVTNESAARTGATLVESLVHSSNALESHSSHEESRRLNRRRPGRPPKSKMDDDKLEHQSRIRVKKSHRATPYTIPKKKNKNTVQCICNSPQEEFGTMVQCDDCLHWLHSDCLELSDQALKQSFRCPSCLIVSESDEPESVLSWRHLAQWKSQRLADTQSDMTSDEEDDTDYIPLLHKPRVQTKSQLSKYENYYQDDDVTDDNDTMDSSSAPLTPVDQIDFFPFDDHPSEDSVSEVDTPERQTYYEALHDHFIYNMDTMDWDPDTLNTLVYLAHEYSTRYALEHVFPQHGIEPFAPENLIRDESLFSGPSQVLPSVADDLPSDLCPEYAEDFIAFCGYMP